MLIFIIVSIIIIICLVFTLLVASLTLVERKLLSLIQRRVGPKYIGFNGRLQYIADALKLIAKGLFFSQKSVKFEFYFIFTIIIIIVYFFWVNFMVSPFLLIDDIEFNILFYSMFSMFFSVFVLIIGILSKNKYSFLGSIRFGYTSISLEFICGLIFLLFITFNESLSFINKYLFSNNFFLIIFYMPLFIIFFFFFIVECGRTPFDMAESESEIIAGYTTELSGFLFVMFYLGEYFHLILISCLFSIFMF